MTAKWRLQLFAGAMALASTAAPALAQKQPLQLQYPVSVAVTYDAMHANPISGRSFWMQGGSVQIAGRFYRGLSAVADVSGEHAGNINSTGVDLNLITATFGPRLAVSPRGSRWEFFGHALGGVTNGFDGVFPAVGGASETAKGAAVKLGVGTDCNLNNRLAARVFEVDWLHIGLPNGASNVQENMRIGAGLVVRFR